MIMVFRRYFRLLGHRLPKLKIRWCMRQLVYIENCKGKSPIRWRWRESIQCIVNFLLHNKPTPIGSKVISTWSPADLWGKVRSRDLDASKQKPRNVPLASADVCEKDDCVTSPKECLLVRRCYESGTNSKWESCRRRSKPECEQRE